VKLAGGADELSMVLMLCDMYIIRLDIKMYVVQAAAELCIVITTVYSILGICWVYLRYFGVHEHGHAARYCNCGICTCLYSTP